MDSPKPTARLFIDADLAEGLAIAPDRGQSHYLANVMRVRPGDAVALFNGRDGEWRGRVADVARNAVTLTCEAQSRVQAPEPDVWLAFAPLKKTPTDFLVEKATELGVARLIPVFTRFTAASRVNRERLAARAVEAAEQCERLSVPEVADGVSLGRFVSAWPADRPLLVLDETGSGRPIAAALADFVAEKPGAPRPAHGFLIGPEGGFATSELDGIRKHPFVTPVSVGPRILRAETAAVAALACWQALAGDWR